MMKSYQAWLLCLLSALLLGVAQPFYSPALFGGIGAYQWLLGALALIGYVPLWLVLARSDLKNTFAKTFVTLTLQYIIILFWIYIACHDYGDISPFFSAGITVLLPMEIAFVGALFLSFGNFISKKFKCSFFFIAPIALTAMEYFRNYLPFGGFPWGNSGYALGRIPEFLQFASIFGVYGLVFIVGLSNSLLSVFITNKKYNNLIIFSVLILFLYLFGLGRLNYNKNEYAPSVRIALLQGNIPQNMKNKARIYSHEIIKIYRDLHQQALEEGAELIIWPEAAFPTTFNKNIEKINLSFTIPAAAVIGATAYGFDQNSEEAHFHNSAFLLDYEAKIISRYDKRHLVPFGEYVPWPLEGLVTKVVPGLGAYRPGTNYEPVNLALGRDRRITIGTTICYEGIFPEISRAYAKQNAGLLVNITNDAWYGVSSAPYQHLLMYQLRAVESGLPYARATNSGVSAWIDAYGRIHKKSKLFTREVIVDNVALLSKTTVYTYIGDIVPIVCSIVLLVLSCILIYRRLVRMG